MVSGTDMNKLSLLALAAMAALTVSPAMGQGMMKKPMMHKGMMMKMDKASMMMMEGLTPAEKRIATHMMGMMTRSEKAAMAKAGKKCMTMGKDGMKMDPMSDAMMRKQMTMGMSKSEKMHLTSAMKKMTPAEKAVAKKMMINCYRMGMKSGKM